MKKLGVIAFLFTILVILPAGSWWYLQQGFNYRMKAASDLEPKADLTTVINNSSINALLKGNTSLLVMENQLEDNFIADLFDQYKEAYTFQMISNNDLAINAANYKYIPADSIVGLQSQLNDFNFVLIDTSATVRGGYGDTKEEAKRLIEQIAILIPRGEELDIKMKNKWKGTLK
jgi:hypothetical protein